MNRMKVIKIINILLACAMVIHVGVKMYIHTQHPEWSAPCYVQIVNAVYYLIPLLVINVINAVWKEKAS